TAEGKFMGAELAEGNCSAVAQPDDDGGILRRKVIETKLRMAGGRDPLDVEDVLQPDRNAMKRAARPIAHDLRLRRSGVGDRHLRIDADEGIEFRVESFDSLQAV